MSKEKFTKHTHGSECQACKQNESVVELYEVGDIKDGQAEVRLIGRKVDHNCMPTATREPTRTRGLPPGRRE